MLARTLLTATALVLVGAAAFASEPGGHVPFCGGSAGAPFYAGHAIPVRISVEGVNGNAAREYDSARRALLCNDRNMEFLSWYGGHTTPEIKPAEKVVYSFSMSSGFFDGKGTGPEGGLLNVKGALYGTTHSGGVYGQGTVFAMGRKSDSVSAVFNFSGLPQGGAPMASLIDVKGKLYGTTYDGGSNYNGVVYTVTPGADGVSVIHSFGSGSDGFNPEAGLTRANGALYGTTYGGGTYGYGTVYSISNGAENVVHSFGRSNDGAFPKAALIHSRGYLYGTTSGGGTLNLGTLFSINPLTGKETVIHSFGGNADGKYPYAALVEFDGRLYGTTDQGGVYGYGTVFSMDLTTHVETVLYSFCAQAECSDGANPVASLVELKGKLFGTTSAGGNTNSGTVFSIDPARGYWAVLHSFGSGGDGARPLTAMTAVKNTLYGTTYSGGAYGFGTIFSMRP